MMKKTFLLFHMAILLTLTGVGKGAFAFVEEPDSFYLQSVKIIGKTNVNRFHLSYNPHHRKDLTIKRSDNSSKQIAFRIPVKDFESENPRLTRDFNQFMQADSHPYIQVRIKKSQLRELIGDNPSRKIPIQIKMAGKKQQVESRFQTRHDPGNSLQIEGIVQLNLLHFNLEPPQKMMGLIQVKDKIFINFDVVLSIPQTALNK